MQRNSIEEINLIMVNQVQTDYVDMLGYLMAKNFCLTYFYVLETKH